MYSFNFPIMIGSSNSKLLKDKDAVKSNLFLLLASERNTLFGDPYYGTTLKHILFEQPTTVLKDLIIDEIYTSIITFIPQIFVDRKSIVIYEENNSIFISIHYIYKLDNTSDLYTIKLIDNESF